MMRRLLPLTCAVFALGILLFPTAAQLQERTPGTPAADTGQPAGGPADQKQGELNMPAGQGGPAPSENEVKAAPPARSADHEESKYTIKQGDTLWDIANAFYRDPFLWPLLWKANPYITNPDLIYPGSKLAIPSLAPIERAIEKPAEEAVEEKTAEEAAVALPKPRQRPAVPAPAEEETPAKRRIILPEEAAVPIIDKYSMLNAGFINHGEADDRIIGSLEPKTVFAYDDIVYIRIASREDVNIGDKFLIYLPLKKVKHPKTGDTYGRLIKVLGILQVTAKDKPDALTARITLSFDATEIGSFLTPYQEPSLVYEPSQKRKKDISGYIIEVVDGRTINAQIDVVYLDKGGADGIEPGDRLNVFIDNEDSDLPRKLIGEVQVFTVKDNTSTAVVRKSTDTLAKGDRVEFTK